MGNVSKEALTSFSEGFQASRHSIDGKDKRPNSSWRAVRSRTSKRPSETRPVACIMSAIERVSPRTKGSQQRTEIITTAAAIPSHGLISKKKGLEKKAGEMNMSTLRRGSSSGVAMSGIRTPTQFFILERVKTRKGGPTGPGGGFRCDIGPLRRTGGGNGAPLAGGGGPKRSFRGRLWAA